MGYFPTLGVISTAIIAKDLVNIQKYIDLINNGEIKNFPSFMDSLEKYDKRIYNILMSEYYNFLMSKIDMLNAYIEDERFRFFEEFKNNKKISFDVSKEKKLLNNYKLTKDTLLKVYKGETTWENVHNEYINNLCYLHTVNYCLNNLHEEEIIEINKEVEHICKFLK